MRPTSSASREPERSPRSWISKAASISTAISAVLRDLYRLGLRSFQLSAHNWANNFADSCCAPAKWHGLNDRGRAVIREANRLGHGHQRLARLRRDDLSGDRRQLRSDPGDAPRPAQRSTTSRATCPTSFSRSSRPRAASSAFRSGTSFTTSRCSTGAPSMPASRSGTRPRSAARKRP